MSKSITESDGTEVRKVAVEIRADSVAFYWKHGIMASFCFASSPSSTKLESLSQIGELSENKPS